LVHLAGLACLSRPHRLSDEETDILPRLARRLLGTVDLLGIGAVLVEASLRWRRVGDLLEASSSMIIVGAPSRCSHCSNDHLIAILPLMGVI